MLVLTGETDGLFTTTKSTTTMRVSEGHVVSPTHPRGYGYSVDDC